MYKYILESAGNINWMALFALITFMIVFCLSAYLILMKNTSEVNRLASLPLDNDELSK